jgi:hypothetical protein
VRRAMKRVALHLTEATEIVIHVGHGAATMTQREEDTPLPERPIPPVPPKRLSPCQKRIWLTVAKSSAPMTQEKISAVLAREGYNYSESAITKALAGLTRDGFLQANPHAKPPGYTALIEDAEDIDRE